MNVLTIQEQISEIISKLENLYINGEHYEILEKLKALNLWNATVKDIETIVANNSWVRSQAHGCCECGNYSDEIMEIGEVSDYESETLYICKNCLKKAIELFDKKKETKLSEEFMKNAMKYSKAVQEKEKAKDGVLL